MNPELVRGISREEVASKMQRVEPAFSVSENIADELSLTVFDQKEAMQAVGKRLAMWQTGLTEPDKPIGVLFFAGPPGVGKTETAHAISKYFFQDANSERLIRLDMSDYQEPHTAQKLTGSPPGYVGWAEEPALPHAIFNKRDYPTIVLLDEIEKAHLNVLHGLLQAFDKGEINARTGSKGFDKVDLTRTLFIMTSNIASEQVVNIEKNGSKRIGFGKPQDTRDEEIQQIIKNAMKSKFPPEFLDRVDQFVRFRPLESQETRRSILLKFLGQQNNAFVDRFGKDAPYLTLTAEAQDYILAQKDDKGGRGIKRLLTHHITSQLPDVMMGMDYKRRPFVADIDEGKTFWYTDVRDPEVEEYPLVISNRKKGEPKKNNGQRPPETSVDDREGDLKIGMAGDEAPPPPSEEDTGEEDIKELKKLMRGGVVNIFQIPPSEYTLDIFAKLRRKDEVIAEGLIVNFQLGAPSK